MQHDDTPEILPPDRDDVETHARDAVEAMRASGTLTPEVEHTLAGGAKRHAGFLDRHGLVLDWTGAPEPRE